MSAGPVFHGVPLPATRDAALAYFDTYTKLAKHYLVLKKSTELPYTRHDYIAEITAFFGERKDRIEWPLNPHGKRRASTSRTGVDEQGR